VKNGIWCILFLLFVGFAFPQEEQTAPAFSFVGKGNDTLTNTMLQGRLVYIYFWASWNPSSRKHHPVLVKLYEKYRMKQQTGGKRFDVADISLDEQDYTRLLAMKQDDLHWPYHACDFKGWEGSYVQAFGVERIPASFLINEHGKIIARDLFGKALEQAVDSVLVSN
jgi:thiol-disulfide isomerase/thioredoxin